MEAETGGGRGREPADVFSSREADTSQRTHNRSSLYNCPMLRIRVRAQLWAPRHPRRRRGTRRHRQGPRGRPRALSWPLAATAVFCLIAVLPPECHINGTAYCAGFGVRFLHAARSTWDSPASCAGSAACLSPAASCLAVWPRQAGLPAPWWAFVSCTVCGDYE